MNRVSIFLCSLLLVLVSLGVMMVFNTTAAEIIEKASTQDPHHVLMKQAIFVFMGLLVGVIVYKVGYAFFVENSGFFLAFFSFLLLLVYLPGVGQQVNGAYRWISVLGFSFQPSEFVKFCIPLYYVHKYLRQKAACGFFMFCKQQIVLVLPVFLILIEPDNGTAAIIIATLTVLYFLTHVPWKYWALPMAIVIGIGGMIAVRSDHVMDRIRVYLNPELDLLGKGHQPYQAKIAAGSGGLYGRGLGESLQKLNYLPEARNDYIAAIYAEEFGFIGMIFLIVLYMGITLVGFFIAMQAKEKEGFYTASILTFLLSLQAFLNLGVVSGLLPSKGINLPFFSQGGSSFVANSIIIAILISINRRKELCEKQFA